MTADDLQTVLGWATDEGWNPGLDDAAAFLAADPSGFLLKEVDGAPVAAISVVNHNAALAFLGLYLCKPDFRGQGHGMDVWRAGIAHAGTRSVGLDGVPDQQENYARSGFVKYGSTIRFEGRINAEVETRGRSAAISEIETLITHDARACGGDRLAFATAWFHPTPNRQTMVLTDGSEITGWATFRRCISGTKVGPLYADTQTDAQVLLASNPFATGDEPVIVDVQGQQSPLGKMLQRSGFEPVFETARMFKGPPPEACPTRFHAIATMELG